MEALKLAFETIIVGALALPWCAVAVDLFFAAIIPEMARLLSLLKQEVQRAVAGVVVLAVAYLLGATVSRVAEDLFNDGELTVRLTEDMIRTRVYRAAQSFVPP